MLTRSRGSIRAGAGPAHINLANLQNGLAQIVDGVGALSGTEVPAPAPTPTYAPTPQQQSDVFGTLVAQQDRIISLLEQQQDGWFVKMLRRPWTTLLMLLTGICLVVGCAFVYDKIVMAGCVYAKEQLNAAVSRQDYGTMELYSQQVNRLCSMNNRMRIAMFDQFGKFVDGFTPVNLITQVIQGSFGWTGFV